MACLSEEPKVVSSPTRRWSGLWMKNKKALNNVLFAMHLQSLPKQPKNSDPISSPPRPTKAQDFAVPSPVSDRTSLLSNETLLYILSKLPDSQRNSNSLVSKRWLNLQGRLVRSIKLLDWDFLVSGRLFHRFPNLIHLDLVNGSVVSPRNSGIFCSNKSISFNVDCSIHNFDENCSFLEPKMVLGSEEIDGGLKGLANGYPNLRRLAVMNASEMGVLSLAEECPTLQELDLHMCNDQVLRGIAACHNLQILRLIGSLDGFYNKSLVSDVGLTILAQGCKRLVKLELSGCEGSYEGIKAIGQCCQMLEELTISDHRMEGGWLYGLCYCRNLKSLRFVSCRSIDRSSEVYEEIGCCPTLERLHLEKCQLRDRHSLGALFSVCQEVKEVIFHYCWGLDNDMFRTAVICRRVKFLSLEGCSLLTIEGLEHVLLSLNELQSLRVVSCKSVKDNETSQPLSALFDTLKDLKWRPDTKSLVSATVAGSGMGKRGSRFFRKVCDWKSLPGA